MEMIHTDLVCRDEKGTVLTVSSKRIYASSPLMAEALEFGPDSLVFTK